MKIAVIGAGFAGLAATKVLTQFGHDVTCFEKAPDVGGVWSRTRRYPGLSTQNNKGTYALSDLPMPAHYPEWPSGAQVQEYLESYVRMFSLGDGLRLGTEVVACELAAGSGSAPAGGPGDKGARWSLRTRRTVDADADARPDAGSDPLAGTAEPESCEEFDFVVVANGIFSTPFVPSYPGAQEWEKAGGRLCAPSDVHSLDEVRGKDVLVIGYGKSSCDIASAVAGTAASTTVVARQLIWKMPKMILGKLNFKHLMLTRLGEGLFEYHTPVGPERFLHGPGKGVRNSMLGSLESVATKQLGLAKMGLVPEGGFERIGRSTVSLTTDGFYEKARRGLLKVVRDAQITRLLEQAGRPMAELSTGEVVPADLVIAATGWRQGVPFLSDEVQRELTDERGNFELYRFILPHTVPGLAFCGYNSSFFSPLSAEVAALWIANYLMGGAKLPTLAERRRATQERLRWMEERTEGHHARGTNIIPFSMHNIDECLAEIGVSVPATQRAREWLLPVNPSDYAPVTTRLLRAKAELSR